MIILPVLQIMRGMFKTVSQIIKKCIRKKHLWLNQSLMAMIFLVTGVVLGVNLFGKPLSDSGQDREEYYSRLLKNVYRLVQGNYVDEKSPKELFKDSVSGLLKGLNDPYAAYLDDKDFQNLNEMTTGEFSGVGIHIISHYTKENLKDYKGAPYVEVVSPIEGTPAYQAGIRPGDYIYAINGESAKGFVSSEVADRVRGRTGTRVRLTLLRGKNMKFDVTLTRANIHVPAVKSEMIGEDILYVRLIQFSRQTAPDFSAALQKNRGRYRGLILDLRNNPGGLLTSVVSVADMILPEGVIVSTRSRIKGENRIYRANPRILVPQNVPILILINKGSASASEILTGALKDHRRAIVVGQTSFGKGVVQQIFSLGNESAIKFTVSRYYTPSGHSIDKKGITPDLKIPKEEISKEKVEAYTRIFKENLINTFLEENPDPDTGTVNRFIDRLRNKEKLPLSRRDLEEVIYNRIRARSLQPAVYDLKYDRELIQAVRLMKGYFKKGKWGRAS